MTLTIVLDDKSKQRINLSPRIYEKGDGSRKSEMEVQDICKTIAHDVSRGNYKSFTLN